MKKINNIVQLQLEQEKLEIKQAYIESALIHNWSRIKNDLSIKNLANETVHSLITVKTPPPKDVKGLINAGILMGASLLLRKWMTHRN